MQADVRYGTQTQLSSPTVDLRRERLGDRTYGRPMIWRSKIGFGMIWKRREKLEEEVEDLTEKPL